MRILKKTLFLLTGKADDGGAAVQEDIDESERFSPRNDDVGDDHDFNDDYGDVNGGGDGGSGVLGASRGVAIGVLITLRSANEWELRASPPPPNYRRSRV